MLLSSANTKRTDKLRLLILTDEMEVGGTQRQIVHMARALDQSLYEVKVAYFCHRSFLADQLEAAGIPVIEISKNSRIDLRFIHALVKFLRAERFDVVHCFALPAEFWGAIARRFVPAHIRPALITSVRNKYDWYSPWQWRLKRWTATESNRVIANSFAGGNHAREKMCLPPGAIDVVYNGVEETILSPISALISRPDVIRILFVGRLVEQKNVSLLIRAMKIIENGPNKIRLRIVGDGPLRQNLSDQIIELGLSDDIELLGERDDIHDFMAAADFVVSPSVWEGLSNVILEAMMSGKPVVASAVGGSVELVDHMQTGILFPSNNVNALAEAINLLATDVGLSDRLGAAGRQRVIDQFSVSAMVRNMQGFYSQAALDSRQRNLVIKG